MPKFVYTGRMLVKRPYSDTNMTRLVVRMTDDELSEVKRIAAVEKRNVSSLIRYLLAKEAGKLEAKGSL